jgi:hypothetical protein
VSGYLYHKTGHECWLSLTGESKDWKNFWVNTGEWSVSRWTHRPLHPLVRGRSLCTYLLEESEEDGIRAFVDLSLTHYYAGILPHRELVEQNETTVKTLFVCFDEITNPATQVATFQKMMDSMFLGLLSYELPNVTTTTNEGHSTRKDPEERARLMALVETFDWELFHGLGANMTKRMGCA